MSTYSIIDYFTGKRVSPEIFKTYEEASNYKDLLLREKSRQCREYSKDYTNYNWLLLVNKNF